MFLNKKQKTFSKKIIGVSLLIILLIGGGIYGYFFRSNNLNEELGYVRAVEMKNNSYIVTFDAADWLFSDEDTANQPATKTISNLKASASLYYFLKRHQSYFNTPVAIYLDQNQTVVKIELIEDKP